MEIKFVKAGVGKLSNLNFMIPSGKITGITGKGRDVVLEMIFSSSKLKGNIYFDEVKKQDYSVPAFYQDVVFVEEVFVNHLKKDLVYDYFVSYLCQYHISVSNIEDKIKGSFKIVGLDESILSSSFYQLASSDLKLVQLALCFLSNPKVILLEEPFLDFDEKQVKKVYRILEKLKDKYHKTIVISSTHANVLYQYTEHLIVLDSSTLLAEGKTEDVYFQCGLLEEHAIEIPEVVRFIQLAYQKKNIRLDHRKDVRDVIKDIYRSV